MAQLEVSGGVSDVAVAVIFILCSMLVRSCVVLMFSQSLSETR